MPTRIIHVLSPVKVAMQRLARM